MKKIILSVCAALMLFCGGASAKVSTMKSSFFLGSSAASYNEETGKFEWSTTWNNMMDLFRNLQGQVSKYKHLKIKLSEATHGYRLLFYKGNDNVVKYMQDTDTAVDLDLTKLELKEGWTIDDIDRICIAGAADGTGSFTIMPADVTLETDDIETLTVTTTVGATSDFNAPFQWYNGTEPRTQEVENNFGKTGEEIYVLWGYNNKNSEAEGYFNLNGYSALLVKVNNFDATKNQTFRVMSADGDHAEINMTSKETLVPFKVSKCTSLKSASGHTLEQEITSIDFIGEYQAVNTESPFAIAASKDSKISYDRNFTQDQPSTVCLPFALTAEELAKVGKAYTLSAVNGSKATFTPVEAIEAYKPYLLIPSADGKLLENISAIKNITAVPTEEPKISVSGSYSFVGTLQAKESVKTTSTEVYGFSAQDGKFVHAGDKASIDAFRAYISVPTTALSTAASRSIDIDFGGTTGINEIQNAQSSSAAATYDFAGKRVGKNYKGVVIRNGKKMIQK
ncbi:hypothetical protein V7T02_09625 [Segatella copri]|uniref:hypothetical protein n=1 Tax=Segatella copri TaxID=165179 RepID=UPI002FF3C19D